MKKSNLLYILIICLISTFTSCKKEEKIIEPDHSMTAVIEGKQWKASSFINTIQKDHVNDNGVRFTLLSLQGVAEDNSRLIIQFTKKYEPNNIQFPEKDFLVSDVWNSFSSCIITYWKSDGTIHILDTFDVLDEEDADYVVATISNFNLDQQIISGSCQGSLSTFLLSSIDDEDSNISLENCVFKNLKFAIME